MNHRFITRYGIVFLLLVFSILLSLGFNQIYHQDEYRWIQVATNTDNAVSPHPPLITVLLRFFGGIFGFDNLRVLPAFFAVLNLLLIYLVSLKFSQNKKIALLAASLFSFNAYSLIAGLQIDIDGAIMPFFVLLTLYAYLHLKEGNKKWLLLFVIGVIGGFFSKESFVLFVVAIAVDYFLLFFKKSGKNTRATARKLVKWAIPAAVLAVLVYFFVSWKSPYIIEYASHFKVLNFGSRAYLDLIFKILKSFSFLSPLVLLSAVSALFIPQIRDRYRILFVYLAINFVFYSLLFDFSTLTIERYFSFMIVSSVIIGADFINYLLNKAGPVFVKRIAVVALICLAAVFFTLAISHSTLPLNPKTAYISQIKSFNLNFLIPFTGGSGPVGFYFSALFILWAWLVSAVCLAGYYLWPKRSGLFLAVFLTVGIMYNVLFIREFLFGKLYGNVSKVARETVDYLNNEPAIKEVITYYDIAPYDLRQSGKYISRFYTAPKRDYTEKLTTFRGHYMVVNFPEIGEEHVYWKLLERCPIIKEFQDKKIRSYIFDCTKLP